MLYETPMYQVSWNSLLPHWTKEEDLAIGRLALKSGTSVSTNETQPSVIQSGSISRGQGTGPSFTIFYDLSAAMLVTNYSSVFQCVYAFRCLSYLAFTFAYTLGVHRIVDFTIRPDTG